MTADEKYSHHHRKKFLQPIQMQAFKKPTKKIETFIAVLKFASSFEHF